MKPRSKAARHQHHGNILSRWAEQAVDCFQADHAALPVDHGDLMDHQATHELERVLPGIELPAYEAYFVYPPALKNSKRVGVFRDFLVGKAREWQF